MALWNLRRTYINLRRLRQIATVFARHGFSHMLYRTRLAEYVPWLGRIRDRQKHEEFIGVSQDLAERLRDAFQELGPVFIKLGQLLATRPDLVAPEFIAAFAKLQDNVKPLPGEQAKKILEERLGKPVEQLFQKFDGEAIASGSIGQVHYAVLNDGEAVVVKIKRPGIEAQIQEDMALLNMFADLAEKRIPELRVVKPKMIVEEFTRTMTMELDFISEASYTAKFRESLDKNQRIRSPRVFWEFSSHDTLVIERIRGIPFSRWSEWQNSDVKQVTKELANCFMRQYFVTGFFHADPHPGNIILCSDGYIGLIDFGQVGHLSTDLRRKLGLMLMALSQGDIDFIADLYAEIGIFKNGSNLRNFKSDLNGLIDRNYAIPVEKLDISVICQDILTIARRNDLVLPRDFVLLVKSLVTVSGIVHTLDPEFRIDCVVKPFTKHLTRELTNPLTLVKQTGSFAYRILNMFRRMPDDFRDLVEKARAGKLTVVFHHENLDSAMSRAETAIDRLTLGIILAAIIISSSIVLTSGKSILPDYEFPVIGNFPLSAVFSAVGFALALFIGICVAWGILRDRKY